MPEMTNDTTRAGPAKFAAATPVITKMPVPTTAPMPKRTSSNGFNTRFKACSPPVLSTSCRMDFFLKMRRGAGPDRSFIAGLFSREQLKGIGRRRGRSHGWRSSSSRQLRSAPGLSSSQRRGSVGRGGMASGRSVPRSASHDAPAMEGGCGIAGSPSGICPASGRSR